MVVLECIITFKFSRRSLLWFKNEDEALSATKKFTENYLWECRGQKFTHDGRVTYNPSGKSVLYFGKAQIGEKLEINLYDMSTETYFSKEIIEANRILSIMNRKLTFNNGLKLDEAKEKREKRHSIIFQNLGYEFDMSGDFPRLLLKKKPRTDVAYKPLAYPFLILHTLEDSKIHLTQSQIKETIQQIYQISIPRETIGKHLKILSEYGYPIRHEKQKDGYWLEK